MGYQARGYRTRFKNRELVYFQCSYGAADLWIGAKRDLRDIAQRALIQAYRQVQDETAKNPAFLRSLSPLEPSKDAGEVVKAMCGAGAAAGVGPMAAVAGAVADFVAHYLEPYSAEVIVENGGDIYLTGEKERIVSLFAGPSPLSDKMGIIIKKDMLPCSVCTSSYSVGPSLSLGKSDASTIIAKSGALADAAATALGNRINSSEDLEEAIGYVAKIHGVMGALGVIGGAFAAWGQLELTALTGTEGREK